MALMCSGGWRRSLGAIYQKLSAPAWGIPRREGKKRFKAPGDRPRVRTRVGRGCDLAAVTWLRLGREAT